MKFTYELTGIGWAESYIEIDGKIDYFSISYLNDALGSLLDGIIHIVPGFIPDDELEKEASFIWHSEPGGSKWNMWMKSKDEIGIRIESYQDIFKNEGGDIAFEACINWKDFVEKIIEALDVVLAKHGFVGYKETWNGHDFPVSSYLKLKYFIIHSGYFEIEEKRVDGYKDILIGDFESEISILESISRGMTYE